MCTKTWTFAKSILSTLAAVMVLAGSAHVVNAQAITVVVNGQVVQFDVPPVERSGRVFVPLRGVFERLGASVVYNNGEINATRGSTTVQLHIGSTSATVNGNPETLDVAPFEIDSRTFVPLRFVSQALGASVNWNNNTSTVTIASPGNSTAGFSLTNLHPASGAVVSSNQPGVSGSFSSPVNPNTVRITLDGRDVSSTTDISSDAFMFSPPYSLIPGTHTVRVTGQDQAGNSFDQSWSFTSGQSTTSNYITGVQPSNGSTVGNNFTISGRTMPNSSVHIVVQPQAVVGGIFTISQGTYVATLQADSSGYFSQPVNVATTSGGTVSVRITSVAPNTSASNTVNLTLHS